MLQAMKEDTTTPHIFKGGDGERLPYEALRYRMQKACKAAGVLYKGLHVYRHTFATTCYYKGCDVKILSKLPGHASAAITFNTYIHLFGGALEDMRSILNMVG